MTRRDEDTIRRFLDQPKESQLYFAYQTKWLGWSGHVRLIELLMDHVDRDVQLAFLDAISQYSGKAAHDFLVREIREATDGGFRWLAVNSLTSMGLMHPDDHILLYEVFLDDRISNMDCKETAYYGLVNLGEWLPQTRPALAEIWEQIKDFPILTDLNLVSRFGPLVWAHKRRQHQFVYDDNRRWVG